MKVLIDIGHPAHVHLFKHFAKRLQKNNHKVLFTCREKEFEKALLEESGFDYKSFGKKYNSKAGKLYGLFKFDLLEFIEGLKFKPDILLSHGSIYAAHASVILRKPHISLEDTFNFEQVRLYEPFTKVILTADYDHPLKSSKVIKYAGYHELAYLHPRYYKPDKTIFQELGIKEDEKYIIVRFVSWKATHDFGHKGISFENKIKAVKEFEKYAKVFISSEGKLPLVLQQYKIEIAPHRMHDALAYAEFVIGESFTMLSEAAVLGTPGILLHNTKCYYLQEQQVIYGLTFNYTESYQDQLNAIKKGVELLHTSNLKEEWQKRREKMLSEKIDVTAFMVWFIENYPDSARIMKENPDYQYNFR